MKLIVNRQSRETATILTPRGSAGPGRRSDKRCAHGGTSLGGQCALSYTHSIHGGRDEFPGNVLVDSHTRIHGAGAAVSVAGTQRRPPPITLALCQTARESYPRQQCRRACQCSYSDARDISLVMCRKAGFCVLCPYHASQARASIILIWHRQTGARVIITLAMLYNCFISLVFHHSLQAGAHVLATLFYPRARHYHDQEASK